MRTMVLAALLPLVACGNGGDDGARSGTGTSRSYNLRDFDAVRLAGSDDVDVRVGGAFSVRAEGDAALLDKLKITRDGNRLTVSRRWSSDRGQVRVYVTLPALAGASIDGSGNMRVDQVRGRAFDARIAGSGNLTVAQLQTEDVTIAIAGSGDVTARGQTQRLSVRVAGSGDVDAADLVARSAEVRVAGSGDVRATVRGAASVSSVGSGDVDLGSEARCSVRKAGSGEVRCGG